MRKQAYRAAVVSLFYVKLSNTHPVQLHKLKCHKIV